MFNILNGYENVDSNLLFFEIKESTITIGHNFTLVNSVLPRLLLQGAAPCPLFVTPCPFEKAEMTPCPFE